MNTSERIASIVKAYKSDVDTAVANGDTDKVMSFMVIMVENALREQKAEFVDMAFTMANNMANSKASIDREEIK